MLLDFAGGMLITTAMVVVVNLLISALDVSQPARLALLAAVGLWIGLQVSLASSGVLGHDLAGRVPLIGVMVLVPPLAVAVAALFSPAVRTALIGLPMPLLIGLHGTRIVGFFFVLLAVAGQMSGPFPYTAGWGDVLTTVLAIPLAVLAARRQASPAIIAGWSVIGIADLLAALVLGTVSFNGGAGGLIPAGVGGTEIESLPWALIPTVLVPAYLIMHGIIIAQLLARPSVTRNLPARA